ncbi:hypothetical protein PN836_011180 [Ningiella sp. W23]|uniref:hypothetical protein n=1 Tax=Ningiella sp. W23 TaxID=3023715 RepID=UPI0037563820
MNIIASLQLCSDKKEFKMKYSNIEILDNEAISAVCGGSRLRTNRQMASLSNDQYYGSALAGAAFFAGVLLVPGIGTVVALTAFSASLISSGIAINAGTN